MPFCPLVFSAATAELNSNWQNAKVDKITQPERDVFILTLRSREKIGRYLLGLRSGSARMYFTDTKLENPQEPPMFCMLLRKYLLGARLLKAEQPEFERAVILHFIASDELGFEREIRLIFEAAGRVPNLILTDGEFRILDCAKRAALDTNTVRPLLPGLFYRLPPIQEGKRSPLSVTSEDLTVFFEKADPADRFSVLQSTFFGLCPLICREILARGDSPTTLAAAFAEVVGRYGHGPFVPTVVYDEKGEMADYTVLPTVSVRGEPAADLWTMLDRFYSTRSAAERRQSRMTAVSRPIKTAHQRLTRKLALQREELKKTLNREEFRIKGDILNAFLYQIPRGQASVTLPDLYREDGGELTIVLDVRLTPQQNAQRYYHEYARLKSAKTHLEGLIQEGERELAYLDEVLSTIPAAVEATLAQLEIELQEQGYLKKKTDRHGKKVKPFQAKPLRFTVDGDLTVLVGRTGKENEALTFQMAGRNDIWFHVKNAPGSHCVLFTQGEEPSALAYTQAAKLAARYSSRRDGVKVEVDYCPVRFVKKLPRAMPGMVTYDKFSTAIVDG